MILAGSEKVCYIGTMMTTTYIMNLAKLNNDTVFERYFSQMPDERQEKILRSKHRMDKNRSLGAGILLAHGLLANGIELKNAVIWEGEYGKPYLAGIRVDKETYSSNIQVCPAAEIRKPQQDIYFNLSHSGDYAAAVFGTVPVGIDIEHERKNTGGIIRRCFCSGEQEALAACRSEEERADLFLRYWTIKESVAKVSGLGMRLPFTEIRLTKDCQVEVNWKDETWKYFFREMELPVTGKDKYRIAVCAEAERFAQEPIWVEE